MSLRVCGVSAVDNVLQRMTIVGVLLSFRSLAQEALLDVCLTVGGLCLSAYSTVY